MKVAHRCAAGRKAQRGIQDGAAALRRGCGECGGQAQAKFPEVRDRIILYCAALRIGPLDAVGPLVLEKPAGDCGEQVKRFVQ